MKKQLVGHKSLLPAQEHMFIGSTPDIIPPVDSADWYKPQGLLTGKYRIGEIETARAAMRYMTNPIIGVALGVSRAQGEVVGFTLREIDPVTGIAQQDPQLIVGKWDFETGQLVGRNLTKDFVALNENMPKEERLDLRLRNRIQQPEGRVRGNPERG